MAKIIKSENIVNSHHMWQSRKVVLVGGCFDLFHFGHLKFLQEAKKQGDYLVIFLESDQFIKVKKKRVPVHTQKERAEILDALYFVDLIILLPYLESGEDYYELIKKIEPDSIAVTEEDVFFKEKKIQAQKVNAKLKVVIPLIKKFSSSKIINYETFSSY